MMVTLKDEYHGNPAFYVERRADVEPLKPWWTLVSEDEPLDLPIFFGSEQDAAWAALIIMDHCPELFLGICPHNNPGWDYRPAMRITFTLTFKDSP